MKTLVLVISVIGLMFGSPGYGHPVSNNSNKLSDESLLTLVQKQTFKFFWDGAEPRSGMAQERYHVNGMYPRNDKNMVATGGSGFGLMAILVGIERNFVSRQAAVERFERIVGFLEKADRFHGAWPHWLNGNTGRTVPFSSKDDGADLVETTYLIQGLLAVRQYFANGNEAEKNLAGRIDALWREVEWDWFTRDNQNVLYWHWSPNFGWEKNHRVRGYNECLITYVLAAASPTHTIPAEVYHEGWARSGKIVRETEPGGLSLSLKHNNSAEYGGPLFWAHYSYLGLDPRGLKDKYADYWRHNKNHTLLNRKYCVENPLNYKGYGKDCWGLTASYSVKGYAAHSPARDIGVISPTAALSSFPYTPEYSMQALKHFYYDLGKKIWGPFGFYDAFSEQENWYPQRYLAIDQGPIIIMIENHRSALIWDLFMSCPEVRLGLRKLGF
ncbi:MAG: beta-glucosidase [Planctomycetes bacterium B3_Pla]|nr:MAG: beta-glucosidase [Planctomycetes bacterium B3_Pla]